MSIKTKITSFEDIKTPYPMTGSPAPSSRSPVLSSGSPAPSSKSPVLSPRSPVSGRTLPAARSSKSFFEELNKTYSQRTIIDTVNLLLAQQDKYSGSAAYKNRLNGAVDKDNYTMSSEDQAYFVDIIQRVALGIIKL